MSIIYVYELDMLLQKTFFDETTEAWVWDGLVLILCGSATYVATVINFKIDGSVGAYNISKGEKFSVVIRGAYTITREVTDTKDLTYFFSAALVSSVGTTRMLNERVDVSITTAEHVINVTVPHAFVGLSEGIYSYYFTISAVSAPTPERQFSIVEK